MNELTVAFLGDVYIAHDAAPPEVDPRLVEMLASCDHVVANFEGPVTSARTHIAKKPWPVMRQSPAVFDVLHAISVDVAGLANNHMGDYGEKGIEDTLQALREQSFEFGGAGLSTQEVYRPVRITAGEARVSLLFGGDCHFGCACDERHEGSGSAWLFSSLLMDVLKLESAECDFVVVVSHAGVENIDRPLPQLRTAYKHLIDNGASAVIGHHPHRAQGCEVHNGAPIFYSIGNLYFSVALKHPGWFRSQIPVLTFNREGLVSWRIEHARFELDSRGGEILYDDSPEAVQRTERLSAEFSDSTYERLLVGDLRQLWHTRYAPCLSPCVETVPSFGFLKRAVRRAGESVYRRRNALSRPVILEAFLQAESERWALLEILRSMHDHNWDTE